MIDSPLKRDNFGFQCAGVSEDVDLVNSLVGPDSVLQPQRAIWGGRRNGVECDSDITTGPSAEIQDASFVQLGTARFMDPSTLSWTEIGHDKIHNVFSWDVARSISVVGPY